MCVTGAFTRLMQQSQDRLRPGMAGRHPGQTNPEYPPCKK
ncbi:hypothetical protein SL1157_2088 [Ruegeria lacuscaerulensis ITI-1157]|nr:hypothetical protein SL1157_2088 [Ruegeria lacuscaerulensis ITI-1157]